MKLLALFFVFVSRAFASDPVRPDPKLTPGVTMTSVTVEQICQRGYANISNAIVLGAVSTQFSLDPGIFWFTQPGLGFCTD